MAKLILDQRMKTWEEFLPMKHKLIAFRTIRRLYNEAQCLELSLYDIDRVFGHILAQDRMIANLRKS